MRSLNSVNTGGRTTNIGLGLLFAAVIGFMANQYTQEGRDWLFGCCVGLVVCAIALLRARHRAGAAILGLAISGAAALVARVEHLPGEPGAAAILALLVLGGSAVRVLSPRMAVGIAAAGLAFMVGGLFTADPHSQSASAPFRLGLQAWFVALGIGLALRFIDYRRRLAIDAVRRDERLALARELHDVVAHHITGIVLQAQAARIVGRKRPEMLDGTLAGIEEAGTEALAAMRRVVGLLRDADDGATTSPEPEQLTELVRRFDGHGPTVQLRLPTGDSSWPPEVTSTIYRVVQEALTNIARHATDARSATVDVAQNHKGITIEITDDAPTSASRRSQHDGFGLIGMRERVEALGGTLRAGPQPGAGWSVFATLPVPAGDRR